MEGCTDCSWELGPPPDSIMNIPPPPMPAFLHLAPSNISTPQCNILCDWNTVQGVEFIELPRQAGALMDNTWLLILVSSCVGVLLFGSLLALILLKFRGDDTGKVKSSSGNNGKSCEAVLYPIAADGRAIWATLTPRGTTTLVAPINSFDNSAYLDADEPVKPRVSCPTRIEHPNLPPLNLHRTLRRNKENNNCAPIV